VLNIALVGYGYWGPNVARQLSAHKKIKFSFICDMKEERLVKAKELYLDQISYSNSVNELLSNPEIDGICLAVETSAHFKLAKKALLAGKHIYIEKPFTSTVAEASELKRLAMKLKMIIHVDHIMVFHPAIQKIKELLDSGEIGDILYFDAQRMNLGQIKTDVSAMWDLAVHDLSIIDHLAGSREPYYISAVGEKHYNPKETITFLTLRYKGFIAHIKSSWISPLKERRLIVAGTKKMIVFDDLKGSEKLMVYDKGVDIIGENKDIEYIDYAVKTRTGDAWAPFINNGDALYNSVDHFINCIRESRPSLTGPDSAIHVIKVLEEADKRMNK